MRYAIIMAAGKGTRMHSTLPKVMHKVCDKPMIEHLVDTLSHADVQRVVSIVGYGHEVIEDYMKGKCEFALQMPQLGTGHAVMQAKQLEGLKGKTLVVNSDCPCIKEETFERMFDALDDAKMVVLCAKLDDPKAYGRVVTNDDGTIEKIVEFKDCNEQQKKIKYINTGIYAFDNEVLFENLKELKNDNNQHEYYITDLVEIIRNKGHKVKAIVADDNDEVQGINDKVELAKANEYLQREINTKWMKLGVNIVDPKCTYISSDVEIGEDVVIYPNVIISGKSKIGNSVIIKANSIIENSTIEDGQIVGPFANIK
ncbi:MAG: sugar phosphate nucleotidyltransferase [Erysipelotrichaceae bacterium]|nr:sugar phosphate nucleotidyltransferase [Erysipelotrichaceae bacterium]